MTQFDNVVMTRTFSKIHGLAGLRIGWGLSFGVLVAYSAQPPAGTIQVTRTLAPLTTDA